MHHLIPICLFFFNDPATTEIYTLSLHDALPISDAESRSSHRGRGRSRKDDGPSFPHQRESLLNREYRTFDIHAENQVEGRFRDSAQGFPRTQAGVGEQHVYAPSI